MPLRPCGSAAGVPPSADQQQCRAGSKSSRTELTSKIMTGSLLAVAILAWERHRKFA
jgi:hypothetical protein